MVDGATVRAEGEPMAVLTFPVRHRGDPGARQMALALRGFKWQPRAWLWRRGRLALSDAALDGLSEAAFAAFLRHLDRHRYGCCVEQGGPGWS
jgi:hypothetical protein